MLKAMAMLGVLAALGGGTYVAVNCTDCGIGADAAPVEVVSGEACTSCCPVEGAAAVAEACPLEGKTEDATDVTAIATPTPAPAEQAAPQAN